MTTTLQKILLTSVTCACLAGGTLRGAMVVDSTSGPVTQNEINSFKTFMSTLHPAITINYWDWTFTGQMGPNIQAATMMYQITGDRAILDKAIEFADVAIKVSSGAPGGGPPDEGSGDAIGHAAFCAKLILENPTIWNQTVGISDPYGYGSTYKQRALSYIQIGTQNMDTYITPNYVNASDKHFKGLTTGLAWNRQTMIANGYHQLANCHELLQDNPNLVAAYRQIVGVNIQWFLSRADFYTASGKPVVKWYYGVNLDGTDAHMEDAGHASYDMCGLTHCFESGLYGITASQMTAFANTLNYVMYDPVAKDWSKRVDGTDARFTSIEPYFMGLARYLTSPDLYTLLYNDENDASYNLRDNACRFALFMTEKNRRYLMSQGKFFQGTYRLVARHSGKSVEIPGGSTAQGTRVDQWTWGGGNHQKWSFLPVPGYSHYILLNRNSGRSMGVQGASTSAGASIIQWTFGTGQNDQWQPVGVGSGYYKFVNRRSGQMLDVTGGGTGDGVFLVQWPDSGGDNQQFQPINQP